MYLTQSQLDIEHRELYKKIYVLKNIVHKNAGLTAPQVRKKKEERAGGGGADPGGPGWRGKFAWDRMCVLTRTPRN